MDFYDSVYAGIKKLTLEPFAPVSSENPRYFSKVFNSSYVKSFGLLRRRLISFSFVLMSHRLATVFQLHNITDNADSQGEK